MKTCEDCGDQRDDTPLNFPVYQRRRQKCLACVVKLRRQKAEAKKEKRARQMARLEGAAVDAMLKASAGGTNIPHSAELLEHTMVCFGGVAGFSKILMKQYFDSKPGSPQRVKLLDMITKLVTTNADQGGSKKPLQFWSEDELEAELDIRLQQAVQGFSAPRLKGIPIMEAGDEAAPEHPDHQ
jgi:hypothetical protein